MILIRDILLCFFIFVAGFFLGNVYIFKNWEFVSTLEEKKIDEKKVTINKVEKDVEKNKLEENSVKQKNHNLKKNIKESVKKYSNYEMFERYLNAKQYQDALVTYVNYSTNENIKRYQNYLFGYVEDLIYKRDSTALILINQFLEIQNDNLTALYLKSKIYNQNGKLQDSISILNNLKIYELEPILEKKVFKTLNEYRSNYIKKLQNDQKYNKLILLLQNIIEEDSNAIQHIYLLGKLYFDLDKYSNAKEVLTQIKHEDLYKNRVNDIFTKINRSEKFSKKIKLQKEGSHFIVTAVLNNKRKVKLLLDTGASYTVINKSIMNTIKYSIIKDKIKIETAGGEIITKLTRINTFAVDDAIIDDMPVVISTVETKRFDGLLGMSYLKKFDFYIDQVNAILYLNKK